MSPTFNLTFIESIGLVNVTFSADAAGSVILKRSSDGVNFSAITNATDGTIVSSFTDTGIMQFWEYDPSASWRLDAALTAGSVTWSGNQLLDSLSHLIGQPPGIAVNMDPATRYTSAQLQQQASIKTATISPSSLAGDLTLYKRCFGGTFAKLFIPAAVQRCLRAPLPDGQQRDIAAASANVVATFDRNGIAVPSARSYLGGAETVYVPGQTVTAYNASTKDDGDFMSATARRGIYGYLTLLEAVTCGQDMFETPTNLAALGL